MSMFQMFFCRNGKADQTAKTQSYFVGVRIAGLPPLKRWITLEWHAFLECRTGMLWAFWVPKAHLCLVLSNSQTGLLNNHRIPWNLPNWVSVQLCFYSTGWFLKAVPVHLHSPLSEDGKDKPSCVTYPPVCFHLIPSTFLSIPNWITHWACVCNA